MTDHLSPTTTHTQAHRQAHHQAPAPAMATLLAVALATALAGCGGGDDGAGAGGGVGAGAGGGATVAAAPLVISAASPATLNGTLSEVGAQYEAGSSTEALGGFASTDPYCRVAAYTLTNSGDGKKYFVELAFRKTDRAIGLVKFGDDGSLATLARVLAPATGIVVDTTNRRIGFTNLVITTGGTSITLNGALSYPSNVAPENRAVCG